MRKLPESVGLSGRLPPVQDQGQLGSSVGHAIATTFGQSSSPRRSFPLKATRMHFIADQPIRTERHFEVELLLPHESDSFRPFSLYGIPVKYDTLVAATIAARVLRDNHKHIQGYQVRILRIEGRWRTPEDWQ